MAITENIKKLGFGFMRLPHVSPGFDVKDFDLPQIEKMVDVFLENGYTYFDTAFVYAGSEEVMRETLVKRHPRETYQIASKLNFFMPNSPDDVRAQFETTLSRLGTDYIDFYLLHGIGENILEKIDNLGGWDFFGSLKKEGKIRHAGFSFHDSPETLDKILTKHPEVEFVQLQLNYFDWEDEQVQARGVYEVARRHNVPIVVMEPVKGGFLGNDKSVLSDVFKKYAPDKSVASWALKFLAEKEGILTILSGMSALEQVQDNVATFNGLTALNDTERALIDDAAAALRAIPRVPCTECRYCKDCPQNIHIPEMLGLYSDYLQCGVLSEHGYNMNSQFGAPATACVSCGLCEQHCPQHIEIRDYLGKIAELAKAFGK